MPKDAMSLREFIYKALDKIGIDEFKSQFNVAEATIYTWARLESLPRPWHMQKIVKLSQGRVSYKEMIESFNKANPQKD